MFRLLPLGVLVLMASLASTSRGDDKKEPKVDFKIKATDLVFETVDSGPTKVTKKYKGKILLVEGEVMEVHPKLMLVLLKGNKQGKLWVGCDLPASQKEKIDKLKVGEKVTIRGRFTYVNGTGNPELDRCEIVK